MTDEKAVTTTNSQPPVTNSVPVPIPISTSGNLFFDPARFEFAQRVANVFAKSTMVPEQFQGNLGNCLIALNYAERTGTDPFMCMQNLYVIHGKPAIQAQFAVAMLNACGKFSSLEYNLDKDKTKCTAYATNLKTGKKLNGPEVSLAMADAEGWSKKPGSKWKTMPEMMLMYRSATYFIRQYAPEVMLGMMTKDELTDIEPLPWYDKKEKSESDLNDVLDVDKTTGEVKTPNSEKAPNPTVVDFVPYLKAFEENSSKASCNSWLDENREQLKEILTDGALKAFYKGVEKHFKFIEEVAKKEAQDA